MLPEPFQTLLSLDEDDGFAPARVHYVTLVDTLSASRLAGTLGDVWPTVRQSLERELELPTATPLLAAIPTTDIATLLAFHLVQSLAYGDRTNDIDSAKRHADAVVAYMKDCRAWVASDISEDIDSDGLTMPRGRILLTSQIFGSATFQQAILLVSRTHAAFLMWEDED